VLLPTASWPQGTEGLGTSDSSGAGSTGGGGGSCSGSGSSLGGRGPGASCGSSSQLVSLRIPDESAPPGGVAQMKFMMTEPTPISSGSLSLATPQDTSVEGIHLFNPAGDVNGVAVINGQQVNILYFTSNGTQGSDSPIMTLALQIPTNAAIGSETQFGLDPSSTWNLGRLGVATMRPIPPANVTIGGSISITNVVPGGGLLPAGTVVSVQGHGFQRNTRIQLSNIKASSIAVVSPQEIRIVLTAPTDMTGKEIQVVNPDGSQDTYFSYLRGAPFGRSNRSLLISALPLFSSLTHSQAVFATASFSSAQQFSGVAVQNQNLAPAIVTFTLFSSSNASLGSSTLVLPSGGFIMRESSELAGGVAPPAGSYLTVSSDLSVQLMGFLGDDTAGTVTPVAALSSRP
jgi:hypothetical protein